MLPFSKKKNIDLTLNAELSTNKLTPGILKIFGDHVSPGSNYKAVRVSTISTAQEVVREALEKFNLERSNPQDFVLCDVIGQFSAPNSPSVETSSSENTDKPKKKQKSRKGDKIDNMDAEKPVWVTEYVRAINEVEKPLVLQSLWKPTDGKSRRFELRNRIELANSFFFINNGDSGESRSPSGTSLVNGSINSNDAHSDYNTDSPKTPTVSDTSTQSYQLTSKSPSRPTEIDSNVAPTYDPYLLMLKGCSMQDKLVHLLQDATVIVGAYLENDKKQCDILLYSSDAILPHCWLYKQRKVEGKSDETNLDEIKYDVFVEPADGADIMVDGKFISCSTQLKPGDLISFGAHYLFMFKDPSNVKDANITLPWLAHIKNAQLPNEESNDGPAPQKEPDYAMIKKRKETKDKCIQVELALESISAPIQTDAETGDDTDVSITSDIDDEQKQNNEPRKSIEKSMLQLLYRIKDEDDLLHSIIDIADGDVGSFKLLPAYFFVMAIEHSACNFTDVQTRKLLLKISSGLQGIAWEKTKEIGKTGGAVKNEETMSLHNRLLPELKPVLFWLTNALQMLHFLQCNLKRYLLPRDQLKHVQTAVLTADEELLSVLEEVIMFTFQQIVYHLTKVLYGALPAVLEVNPFQAANDDDGDDDDDECTKPAHPLISQITQILNDVLIAAQENQIHPQIISQIFAYLFFFCNALLFNSLSEKGPTTKIFRWAKGVQIRGNIDVIEEWAQVNGLGKEFEEFLGKFISAVGLLSTPKVQLMQYEWTQLRNDYPLLNPAQLQLILGEYQLNGKQKPRGWYPTPEEVEAALQTTDVLESFGTHPPLMLPSSNFVLDLNVSPQCDEFFKHLNYLNEKFDNDAEIVDEVPIQPKVRSDHPTTIPILEIKPIPPPPTVEEPQHSDNYIEVSSAPQINLDLNIIVSDHKEKKIVPHKIHETNTKPQEIITIADVHSPSKVFSHADTPDDDDDDEATTPLISEQEDEESPSKDTNSENSNENVVNPNPLKKPPRSSIDLDPKFDADFNDIKKAHNVATDSNTDTTKEKGKCMNGHVENIRNRNDEYHVELSRENNVLGLGLIDGKFTPLENNGIYIRTIVPNTPAAGERRLRIGDRIMSVNGEDVLEKDYSYIMGLIKASGDTIRFVITRSTEETINQILAVA